MEILRLTVKKGEQEDAGHLVVSGQVTDDPRDPLNLPTWHKIAALCVASLYGFVANYTSGVIAPAFNLWPMFFPKDPRTISELTKLIAVSFFLIPLAEGQC